MTKVKQFCNTVHSALFDSYQSNENIISVGSKEWTKEEFFDALRAIVDPETLKRYAVIFYAGRKNLYTTDYKPFMMSDMFANDRIDLVMSQGIYQGIEYQLIAKNIANEYEALDNNFCVIEQGFDSTLDVT